MVRVRSEWEGRKRLRGCEAERLGGDRKVGMGVGGRSMLRGESPAVPGRPRAEAGSRSEGRDREQGKLRKCSLKR